MDEENSSNEDKDLEDAEVPRVKLQPRHMQQLLCLFLEAAEGEDTSGQSKRMVRIFSNVSARNSWRTNTGARWR